MADRDWRSALDKANEVRVARAGLKREIKAGDVSPQDVLREYPDTFPAWLEKMTVGEVVGAVKGMPSKWLNRQLYALHLSSHTELRRVTTRQRKEIATLLDKRDARVARERITKGRVLV